MAGIFDFTGQDIENTYQRVLQTDGNAIYDGTGSSFVVPVSSIDTSSLATTGSNIFTGNQTVIGNVNVTGSVNVSGSITASLFGTASHAIFADTASFAPAYLPLTGGTINGNVTVNGTASVSVLHVTYESASVIYSSGSNQFGDASNDVQTLYGTVDIKNGPVLVTGSLNVSAGITGSLFGTASYALTASFVQTAQTASYVLNAVSASYAPVFPYTGSAIVSGSLEITGSFSVLDAGGSTAINSSTYTLNDAANITSLNWDSKTLNDAFGNLSANWGDRTLYDSTGIDAINWDIAANGYVITQTGYKRDSISSETQENFTAFSIGTAINTAGELINVETNIDLGVAKGDLVSLGEDGIWYQTDQSAISSSCMLGVATDVHPRGKILTEGTITAVTAAAIPDFPFVEGTSFSGKPVYMRPGVLGGFTTTTPTTGYVRVVGHLYYNSTTNSDYWLMKFRPSNDWYEI